MDLKGKKILVIGASSDIAVDFIKNLYLSGAKIGLHYNSNLSALEKYKENKRIKKMQKNLVSANACFELVNSFVKWAGGIDFLVQLSGDIRRPIHWSKLIQEDWDYDLNSNLIIPFFLAQRAILHMHEKGGRIILMSTASASHGGGANSFAYGVAKAGIECMIKGLAKDCASKNILINAIAPGLFITKFHTQKMKRNSEQLEKRANLVPLKRPGTTREFSGVAMFLLSPEASYITGQIITVSGGDWL